MDEDRSSAAAATERPVWAYQIAMIIAQATFVVGSIYLKSGMLLLDKASGEVFSPIIFLFWREALAGPLLLLAAWRFGAVKKPQPQDLFKVLGLGVCLAANQLFYLKGVELAGVAMATCMQPAIPVFTVMLGVLLRMENAAPKKLAGIGLAVAGAVGMVVGSMAKDATAVKAGGMLSGSLCLLVNTGSMALYYIIAKQVVVRYPPLLVTTWAYLTGAACVGLVAAATTGPTGWRFPRPLLGPLAYWVILCSVLAYFIVNWATRRLPPSQVASFGCLQPFLGTLLAHILLGERPNLWDLGAFGIVGGLLLTVQASKQEREQEMLPSAK